MKHFYLTLLACVAIGTQALSAGPVGSAEALRIAQRQYSMENPSLLRSGSFPEFKLAYVGTEEGIEIPSGLRSSKVENALLYLYNVGDDQGFVIVSGEDEGKQLLGISDKGSLPENGLPPAMRNFMLTYTHYVRAVRAGAAPAPVKSDSVGNVSKFPEAVIPLTKTEWRNDAPYNSMCPVIDDFQCFAGGEAVAMAQIMRYYQYPEQGRGHVSYKNLQSLVVVSADFSHTTYDWANMPATLDEHSSWDEVDAVSTLIFHCGAAAYTDYENGWSATKGDIRKALIQNFGYDENMQIYDRTFFSEKEWIDLLKTELAAQRPVYYEGGSGENNRSTKWAFACDGYNKNGLFHLNTGQFGTGYYELGAIYSNLYTFNERQAMITGIRKPSEESSPVTLLCASSLNANGSKSVKLGERMDLSYELHNLGHDGSFITSLAYFAENEALESSLEMLPIRDTVMDLESGSKVERSYPILASFPDSTATYRSYIVGALLGDSILKPIRTENHPYDYILLSVKDSIVTISQARNGLTADPVEVHYDGEDGYATFEVTFHNKQVTDFKGTAGIFVQQPNVSINAYSWETNNWLEIPAGESRKVSFSGVFDWAIGDTLAVVATYQGDLDDSWMPIYTDIPESYRTFCLNIDGSLAVSNEAIEPSVADLECGFDSASGLLSVRSSAAIENMMLYTYDGASVWGTSVDNRKQYTTTLSIPSGHYILKVKTAEGMVSKKIYKR